jgi:hypothetical protein
MNFKPTTRQLETIAELGHARIPADRIAVARGIEPEAFAAWASRLAADAGATSSAAGGEGDAEDCCGSGF